MEKNIDNYNDAWKAIFYIGTRRFELNQPLDDEILFDATHPVT